MVAVKTHQPVEHTARPRKAERGDDHAREQQVAHERIHQLYGQRIAGKKHQLHDLLAGTGIPAARNVQIAGAVEALPEFKTFKEGFAHAARLADHEYQRDHADIHQQQGDEDPEVHMPRNFRRLLIQYAAQRLVRLGLLPELHPFGNETDAHRRKEQATGQRGDAAGQGDVRHRLYPKHIHDRQRDQPQRRDPEGRIFQYVLFHMHETSAARCFPFRK